MKGADWAQWRKRLGYTSIPVLMLELGVSSRQTINNWEKADEVPRLAELALYALEHHPDCCDKIGKQPTKMEGRQYLAKRP